MLYCLPLTKCKALLSPQKDTLVGIHTAFVLLKTIGQQLVTQTSVRKCNTEFFQTPWPSRFLMFWHLYRPLLVICWDRRAHAQWHTAACFQSCPGNTLEPCTGSMYELSPGLMSALLISFGWLHSEEEPGEKKQKQTLASVQTYMGIDICLFQNKIFLIC